MPVIVTEKPWTAVFKPGKHGPSTFRATVTRSGVIRIRQLWEWCCCREIVVQVFNLHVQTESLHYNGCRLKTCATNYLPAAAAVIEEQAPFELLEADGGGVLGAFWVFLHGFNQINESVGIPAAGHEAKQGFVGRERVQKLAGVVGQLLKNGVIAAAGVPIFCCWKSRLRGGA